MGRSIDILHANLLQDLVHEGAGKALAGMDPGQLPLLLQLDGGGFGQFPGILRLDDRMLSPSPTRMSPGQMTCPPTLTGKLISPGPFL